jgi:hypothetical protein
MTDAASVKFKDFFLPTPCLGTRCLLQLESTGDESVVITSQIGRPIDQKNGRSAWDALCNTTP